MTNTLKAAFEHAALAQAAYMNLSTAANSDLSAVLKRGGMTEFMADYISRRYSVYKSSITGGILNPIGYQGIIFQELNADGTTTDNYVLANRGTEASLSVLYNAPQDLIADIFLAGTGTNPQTLQMQSLYNEIPTTATRITTTGHSLGGYLSKMALVKWKTAPQNSTKKIDFAYTYNGAGINNYLGVPSIGQALRAFVELDPLTITNPRAVNYITTENPEIVPLAGVHPGEIRMVNTDVQPPIGAVLGHGIDNLVNALLVAYVFSHIDSSLDNTAGLQKINAMVEGSHRSTTMDGNGAIAALAKLFGLSASTINNALYESDEKLKESNLQKLAFDILSSTGTNTTTGGHSIVPLVTFAANGQTEYHLDSQNTSSLAYRYALTELNPFVIEGLDYSRFNTNGQLNDYNPDTGQGSLTKEWLKDRAAFLQEVLKLNINNSNATQITRNIARSTHYQDLDKNISLTLLSQSDAGLQSADNTYEPNTQKIIFGRNTSIGDNLSGGDLADSLYGGLGNDTLIGGTDQDLLDGGFGNDILDAGEGNDTLIGGAGNDQLTGNLGDDSLDGGLGDDIFSFSTSQGSDTIQDTQGNNTLVINGQQNFIVKRLNAQDNVYVHQSTGNLFLNTSDGLWILLKDQGGSVRVKGWTQSNNFGITLDNEIATQLNLSSQQSPEYHIDTALLDSIIGSLSEEDKQEFAVSLATGSLRSYLFRENVTVIEPIMASVFQPTQGKGLIYNDIGQGSPQGRVPLLAA